jgi:pyruvate-ferredoxin/flavodoxin oxidoreductase
MDSKFKEFPGMAYSVQVAPEDCTGCALCIEACPAKDKTNPARKSINMAAQPPLRESEAANWEFFLGLPEADRTTFSVGTIKNSQLLQPLFEFSGACSGCGETPYVKLMSQLFGDRAIIANATGCSSIYGGNLPTTPYTTNKEGRGPTWSNSLFEDNAEFGLGFRLTLDKQIEYARDILPTFVNELGQDLIDSLLKADQTTDLGIKQQRDRVDALKKKLAHSKTPQAKNLAAVADALVKKSVWIVGGDGWAYDIGYGGLDHVISTGRNVNLLVFDTEVYSNTGGQASKSTPRGAVARFAAQGKGLSKKDLGLMAIAYGYVYVARVAMGFNDQHTLKAFIDAESFDGPSIIIAYSHCISHGIDMAKGLEQQKLAVQCGLWPLYRFDPRLAAEGKNPLLIDYKEPTIPVDKYMYNETRFRMLVQSDEARAEALLKLSREDAKARWNFYSQMAAMHYNENTEQK